MDWFLVAVILFIIEVLTPGVFFFACLGLGAVAAGLTSVALGDHLIAWVAFIVVSIASIYTIRPIVKKYMSSRRASNVDSLIGKKGVVVEKICEHSMGLIKVESELWKAVSDQEIEISAVVEVIRVDGAHLIVNKTENRDERTEKNRKPECGKGLKLFTLYA